MAGAASPPRCGAMPAIWRRPATSSWYSTYRGWGESDGRVVLTGPALAASGTFTAQVTMLLDHVDPFEQVKDWFNAIDWLAAEPVADMTRLGPRGTSYSGGHVMSPRTIRGYAPSWRRCLASRHVRRPAPRAR